MIEVHMICWRHSKPFHVSFFPVATAYIDPRLAKQFNPYDVLIGKCAHGMFSTVCYVPSFMSLPYVFYLVCLFRINILIYIFSNILSFVGALASTIRLTLIPSCRTIVLSSLANFIFACPLLTIASQRECLMILSSVCTGSVIVTVALLCSLLMISFPYYVLIYCTILPCWCASNLLQPFVHDWTHFFVRSFHNPLLDVLVIVPPV